MSQKTAPCPVITKYSKSSSFYFDTKKDFFVENNKFLQKAQTQNQFYAQQPKRTACKLCQTTLPEEHDFTSHGIHYLFCQACDHLNGRFEDSKTFIEKLYISDDGQEYSKNYLDENYKKRTSDIYIPKIDFFLNSVPEKKYKLLDVGCGSGYFVYAALQRKIDATGVDVSKNMIDFGNNQISHDIKKSPLLHTNEEGFYEHVLHSDADVISAIGVIEHLREPHKFFKAFKESKAQYLFYSVPMFSFSVILENMFEHIFPRQLSGAHTHLFTESSIKKMNDIIGVHPISEWRFGTDIMDLYRSCMTSLKKNNASKKLFDFFESGFASKIDDIQSILDRNHFCSEIHCVTEKK